MAMLSRWTLDAICSLVLLGLVILSWSYVIYAGRVASHWLLEERSASKSRTDS